MKLYMILYCVRNFLLIQNLFLFLFLTTDFLVTVNANARFNDKKRGRTDRIRGGLVTNDRNYRNTLETNQL